MSSDEQLGRVRRICAALPETSERTSHGEPTFFVRGKVYVMFADNHHGDGRVAVWLPAPPGFQQGLIDTRPETFFRPPYVGHRGWVGVALDTIGDADLRLYIETAWELIAPRRLRAARAQELGAARERLRHSFGPIAALYDAARPGYPPAVVDLALAQAAAAAPRILEVGCGSGQATELFARAGFPLLASDPSPDLLDLARRRLAAYPNVAFIEGSFEDLELPEAGFDLLIAAQSFHWVDLGRGLPQARRLIAPGGGLALLWNFVHYDADPLLAGLRDICVAHAPAFAGWPDAGQAPFAQFRAHWREALGAAPGFAPPADHILSSQLELPHGRLLQLIASFSWAQALDPGDREALLSDLAARLRGAREPISVPLRTLVVTAVRP